MKTKRIFSRTKTHVFKNDIAQTKKKRRRKFLENEVNLAVASTLNIIQMNLTKIFFVKQIYMKIIIT